MSVVIQCLKCKSSMPGPSGPDVEVTCPKCDTVYRVTVTARDGYTT